MIPPIDNLVLPPMFYNPYQDIKYISQKFGGHWYLKTESYYNGKWWPVGTEFNSIFGFIGHNGVDYSAPRNTPIKCVQSGWVVEQTKKETGYGNRLCVLSPINGHYYLWIYGHADHFATDEQIDWDFFFRSKFVKEGEIIAFVGSSGFSTAPHLHLGFYEYDKFGNCLNKSNGYGGAIDGQLYFLGVKRMSNTLLVKKGSEFGFYLPTMSETTLLDKALNFDYPLPTKNDGKEVEWDKVKPDIVI